MTDSFWFSSAAKAVSTCCKVVTGMAMLLTIYVPPARATSTLPFYELFPTSYAEGSALTVSPAVTVWASGNGTGAGAVTVGSAAALSSTSGLVTSNGSRGLVLTGTPSSNRDRGAVLVEKCVYIDCLYPLRNNQTDVTDTTYTVKILGLDMIYQMDSTVVRGNSTDPGSPLGPFQAPIIAFSWNPASGAPGGVLPYSYAPDDPSQLQSIVTSPTSGAGSGVLTWAKPNWLKTAY